MCSSLMSGGGFNALNSCMNGAQLVDLHEGPQIEETPPPPNVQTTGDSCGELLFKVRAQRGIVSSHYAS